MANFMTQGLFAQAADLNGFLPTRGSIMLDFVFVAMIGIVPILLASIYLVKARGKYQLHKWIQIGLGVTLAIAVTAFEIDMRLFTDWEELASASAYYPRVVWNSLYVHLLFAIPTPLLWIYVIVKAVREFPNPPAPCGYSTQHIFVARIATAGMLLTAVTGWIFYWLAFVM